MLAARWRPAGGSVGVVGQPLDGGGDRAAVGLDDEPGHAVLDEVRRARRRREHTIDRLAVGHRLDGGEAVVLVGSAGATTHSAPR